MSWRVFSPQRGAEDVGGQEWRDGVANLLGDVLARPWMISGKALKTACLREREAGQVDAVLSHDPAAGDLASDGESRLCRGALAAGLGVSTGAVVGDHDEGLGPIQRLDGIPGDDR